jgi:microcystin-dependent protein
VGQTYWATDKDALYICNTATTWLRMQSQPGDMYLTMNTAAAVGRILAQGQTVPRTGLYDELFALWGTRFNIGGEAGTDFRLPDWQGRMPVMVGANAAVNAVGMNDGVALVNRRGSKHRHSPHSHTVNGHAHGGGSHVHAINDPGHLHHVGSMRDAGYNPTYASAGDHGVGDALTSTEATGIAIAYSGAIIASESPGTNAIDGGSGIGTDPLDGGTFIVCNVEIKL